MRTLITIGREFGSGGHQIGTELAKELDIPFYDKELLEKAAKDSGISKEFFESQDEKPTGSFLFSLVMDSYTTMSFPSRLYNELPLNQKIFLAQIETIKKIAEKGSCVLIGRCADYALEYNPNHLSVFLHADLEARIKRVSKLYDLSNDKAKELILKTDKSRATYYNFYTNKKWGDKDNYHLSIDTALYGINGTIELIKKAIEVKEKTSIQNIFEGPMYSSL